MDLFSPKKLLIVHWIISQKPGLLPTQPGGPYARSGLPPKVLLAGVTGLSFKHGFFCIYPYLHTSAKECILPKLIKQSVALSQKMSVQYTCKLHGTTYTAKKQSYSFASAMQTWASFRSLSNLTLIDRQTQWDTWRKVLQDTKWFISKDNWKNSLSPPVFICLLK